MEMYNSLEPMTCEQAKVIYAFAGFIVGMFFTAVMTLRGRKRIDDIIDKYRIPED